MADPAEGIVYGNAADLLDRLEKMEAVLTQNNQIDSTTLEKIAEARRLLGAGKLNEAGDLFTEIRVMVERIEASVKASPMAWVLFCLQLAYLLVLLALGYLTVKWPGYWLWAGVVTLNTKTAWFGALGGIAVGLYGLYTHVQARDFDPGYRLWYLSKPIVGAIFGWFVVVVFRVGILSLQGIGDQDIKSPLLFYVIAFLAGFSERFTIKIIDRLMQVLTTREEKPSDTSGKTSATK
jgi:hypothetical protein